MLTKCKIIFIEDFTKWITHVSFENDGFKSNYYLVEIGNAILGYNRETCF